MRDYIFRGKRIDNGEWVEGFYVATLGKHCIGVQTWQNSRDIITWHDVDPETVGQFTGMHDKDNIPVFEGDEIIIDDYQRRGDGFFDPVTAKVVFEEGAFLAHGYDYLAYIDGVYEYEVIHDKEQPEG